MPEAASVNAQITDAVNPRIMDAAVPSGAGTPGGDPAAAVGALYQEVSHAVSIAVQNAVYAQQQANTSLQAATDQGVETLYEIDTRSAGVADDAAPDAGRVQEAVALLADAKGTLDAAAASAGAPEAREAAAPSADAAAEPSGEVTYENAAALMRDAVEQSAAALQSLNDVAMRQAIRQVELAAVTMTLCRALSVDPAAPNAAEQVRMYEELMRNVIRELSGWAASL